MDTNNYILDDVAQELEMTHTWAIETRKDLLLGEINLTEYLSYVNYCIKRLNLIVSTLNKIDLQYEDKDITTQLLSECEKLNIALAQMKSHAGTKSCENTNITCNSLLKSFKAKFNKYLTTEEIEEAITID